ncbi:MAG: carbohydrate porin [Planctomycetaceae bacterium]|nr:carbohydrate porin [Planctomycetaceae bacterium]
MKTAVIFAVFSTAGLWAFAEPDHMHKEGVLRRLGALDESLASAGLDFSMCLTSIYQINTQGGLSTHRRQGRSTGSYDIELNADLQRLLGIDNAVLYMHTESTWPGRDIDQTSVGSYFGVNGDFYPRNSFSIIELWYEQSFLDDTLRFRVGKLDMTGGFECRGCPVSFDGNAYANDENTQFLNSALINNPTIPFPDYGLGAIIYWQPVEYWYISAGAADAQADRRETGFNTAFHDEDYFLTMAETGITPRFFCDNGPLQGAYRFGMWYDPQPKVHSDSNRLYRDDTGFYLSFDQAITKENSSPDDTQGLGTFFRYGYAHGRANDVVNFYSAGLQYQGLFEGRDDDVLAVGFAHGSFSDRADITFSEDYESVLETYYSIMLTRWMIVSPSLQYVTNPGGDNFVDDALIAGIRAHIAF